MELKSQLVPEDHATDGRLIRHGEINLTHAATESLLHDIQFSLISRVTDCITGHCDTEFTSVKFITSQYVNNKIHTKHVTIVIVSLSIFSKIHNLAIKFNMSVLRHIYVRSLYGNYYWQTNKKNPLIQKIVSIGPTHPYPKTRKCEGIQIDLWFCKFSQNIFPIFLSGPLTHPFTSEFFWLIGFFIFIKLLISNI